MTNSLRHSAFASFVSLAMFAAPAMSQSEFDAPPEGECYIDRGSFDCAAGQHCEIVSESEAEGELGECVDGGSEGNLFTACTASFQCEGGLCEEGVCTVPCDVGCPGGYTCDADAITGGLCVPESCTADSDCAEGMACYDTDDGARCLSAAPPAASSEGEEGAGCSANGNASGLDGTLAALVGGLFLVGARRRRR